MQIAGRSQSISTEDALSKQNHSHCVATAAKSLLTDLRSAAKAADLAFEEQDWAAAAFGTAFTEWLSAFTYTRIDLADPSVEFPVIWLIARHHSRLDAMPRSALLVAVALNPTSRRYLPISGSAKGITVPDLAADTDKLIDFVTHVAVSEKQQRLRLAPSLKSVQAALTKLHARVMETADELLELVAEGACLRAPQHVGLTPLARKLMLSHLKRRRSALNADIARTVETEIVTWAERIVRLKHATTPLAVYNHVLAAPSPAAVKHRRNAIDLLSESGRLHLADTDLWSKVDLGQPPQDIIAPLLGIRPSTLRIALKHWANVFCWRYIAYLLPWLDALDPSQWPMTDDDRHAFVTAIGMVNVFGPTFELEPRDVLRDWKRQAGKTPWFPLVEARLARHSEAQQRVLQEVRYNPMLNSRANMAFESAQFATDVKSVDHMRHDINRRLILAAVRLEADRLGAGPQHYADAAHRVGRRLAARMWAEAKPSEQLLISARWHVAQRTWSDPPASATSDAASLDCWRTLIEAPLSLTCGIVVHPLDSAAKLREEGGAMQHCVGSMSLQCRLGTTHIFSLRDTDGCRLSTLSVESDIRPRNGRRLVALRENLAVRNAAPPARAVEAALEFIARVNGSDLPRGILPIAVDWPAVDASRQPLQRSDAADRLEFGFAIHAPDEREAATHLIWPFLPQSLKSRARSIAGDAPAAFADLATAVGVPEAMAMWSVSSRGCP